MSADDVTNDMVRKTLLDHVAKGSLTPRQAELSALSQGIDLKGNGSASRASLDPMREPWWTFAMTLAWIAWRTPAAVQEHWDDYVEGQLRWVEVAQNYLSPTPRTRVGYELRECSLPSAFSLLALEAFDGLSEAETAAMSTTIRESKEALFKQSAAGKIKGVGMLSSPQSWPLCLRAIESHEWPYLALCYDDEKDVLRLRRDLLQLAYSDVLFNRSSVEKCWPRQSATLAAKKLNQHKLEKWFTEQVAASVAEPTMTKSDYRRCAQVQFGVSKDPADSIWKMVLETAVAPAWSRSGRRRGNRPETTDRKRKTAAIYSRTRT